MNDLDNGVTRGDVWYQIYGGRQDFVTYELQGREVTIELDDQIILLLLLNSLYYGRITGAHCSDILKMHCMEFTDR